jgi:hypothetical protein
MKMMGWRSGHCLPRYEIWVLVVAHTSRHSHSLVQEGQTLDERAARLAEIEERAQAMKRKLLGEEVR